MNHLSEEQLIEFRYGDGSPAARAEAENQLKICAQCREANDALAAVVAMVEAAPVPERDAAYGARVWRQIEPKLKQRSGFNWRAWFTLPRLSLAGAMAVVIIAAFVAGRYWQGRQTGSPQLPVPQFPRRSASAFCSSRWAITSTARKWFCSNWKMPGRPRARPREWWIFPNSGSGPKTWSPPIGCIAKRPRGPATRAFRSARRAGTVLIQVAHSPSQISFAHSRIFEELRRARNPVQGARGGIGSARTRKIARAGFQARPEPGPGEAKAMNALLKKNRRTKRIDYRKRI